MNITSQNKFSRVSNAAASANGDTLLSDIVDTSGLSSITFVVSLGATVGTGTVKLQQSAANDTNTFSDVAGSSYSYSNAVNKLVLIEAVDPRSRYIRAAVVRDTNSDSILNGIIAIQGKAEVEPVTQGSTVISSTILPSPANA